MARTRATKQTCVAATMGLTGTGRPSSVTGRGRPSSKHNNQWVKRKRNIVESTEIEKTKVVKGTKVTKVIKGTMVGKINVAEIDTRKVGATKGKDAVKETAEKDVTKVTEGITGNEVGAAKGKDSVKETVEKDVSGVDRTDGVNATKGAGGADVSSSTRTPLDTVMATLKSGGASVNGANGGGGASGAHSMCSGTSGADVSGGTSGADVSGGTGGTGGAKVRKGLDDIFLAASSDDEDEVGTPLKRMKKRKSVSCGLAASSDDEDEVGTRKTKKRKYVSDDKRKRKQAKVRRELKEARVKQVEQ